MTIARRTFLAGATAASVAAPALARAAGSDGARYGLIGKMTAKPGQRDALTAILLEGIATLPGCLSYVVAHDPVHADTLWITEAWVSQEAHAASLSLPAVRAAIARARPILAGMEQVATTIPVGGTGVSAAR